jgi:hypothetical protein
MKEKDNILNFIVTIIIIGLLTLTIYYSLVFTYIKPSEIGKSYVFYNLKSQLDKKDLLNLDWDNVNQNLDSEYFKSRTKTYSDLNYFEFSNILKQKFTYDIDTYDCKYFAFIWALYFEKHKIPYQFKYTSNHIFVIAYIENGGFCIANLQSINCYVNKNGN